MRSRTLNRPGIEFWEKDISQFTDEVNSTTSLVMGFSAQGKSDYVYDTITSVDTLKRVLGEPKTEAERYSYYAAKRVLTQKGRLLFFRIPYANETEKFVPAYRYFIDEDKVSSYTGDKAYIPTKITTDDVLANLRNIGMQSLDDLSSKLEVTTTKSGSDKVFPGYSTVTKLLKTNDTAADIALKDVWDTTNGHFVTLVDSEESKVSPSSCSANEDSRFITVTDVIDKAFTKEEIVTEDGKDWKGSTVITTAIGTQFDNLIKDALKKELSLGTGVTFTIDGTITKAYSVKGVKALSFNRFDGTTDNVEGMYLTKGLQNGFYPSKIRVTVNAKATYTYTRTDQGTKKFYSTDCSYSSQNQTIDVDIDVSQAWDGYLRASESDLNTATLCISETIDTSKISGIDGIFGKGNAPAELAEVDRIVRIHRTDKKGYVDATVVDELRDGDTSNIGSLMEGGTGFVIVNSSNNILKRDDFNNSGKEVLGIVPFVFTGFNKLAASRLITPPDGTSVWKGNTTIYQAVQGMDIGSSIDGKILSDILASDGFRKQPFTVGSFDTGSDTISNSVASYFPNLVSREGGKLPGDEMNMTAVLVAELSTDPNYDNKVVVTVRELFYGTWDKDASNYLPELINANSEYIEMYTNYVPTAEYTKNLERMVTIATPASETQSLKNFWFLDPVYAAVMGYRTSQTLKLIKYGLITRTIDRAYNALGNIDELDIDLVVDAGLTSIANLCVNAMGGYDNADGTKYDVKDDGLKTESGSSCWYPTLMKGNNINSTSDIAVWKTVAAKLNTFCEVTRKDCLALIDAPRNLTLNYNVPVVKKGGKATVDMDVLPKLKYLNGLNTTYGTMNTTWVKEVDDFTGAQFWCPPSVLKAEKTVWCDRTYGYPWYVAAGTERGTLGDAIDVSLNPYPAQEDIIYANGLNYVKAFKNDGIVIWGQKTLQSAANTSMLGRENVRRMFLFAERKCCRAVKKFLFKPITTALMNNVVDTLTPIMQDIQDHEGCYDYKIVCDSSINTPESIMRNELRCTIAIHPTPLAEYIVLGFLCVGLNITITEELIKANS